MGTRALIKFTEAKADKPFACVYKQFDGYPEGLGAELKEILKGRKLVNGFTDASKQLNGMGCLAAFVVAGLKEGCGNVYLYPADAKDCGEEFTYWLSPGKEGKIHLRVESGYGDTSEIYSGDIDKFNPEEEKEEA